MCQPQGSPGGNNQLGVVRRFVQSVEVWHVNTVVVCVVSTFLLVQFRSILFGAPKKIRAASIKSNKSDIKLRFKKNGKEFADKEVGSDMDKIEEQDDFDQNAKEIPYHHVNYTEAEVLRRSQLFYEMMKLRRSIRRFSSKEVPFKVIQNIIKTAGTSPSGANLQPWTFCVVECPKVKLQIREIVETEEQLNYARRMGARWVLDIAHLNVNWNKPYLTEAPYLVVVMKHSYQLTENGERRPTYYNEISTSIAVGILLAAIQNAGLVTVVTTPLNAGGAIRELLQRPVNEKVSMLLPVGYPADDAHVPDIHRKPVEEIIRIY